MGEWGVHYANKLIKNLETVEKLPLNINILYEIVEKDPILKDTTFDLEGEEDEEELEEKLWEMHSDRIKHFFCSNHKTIFWRECIKLYHCDEEWFVVDLYEIQKMRQLHEQNLKANKS